MDDLPSPTPRPRPATESTTPRTSARGDDLDDLDPESHDDEPRRHHRGRWRKQ